MKNFLFGFFGIVSLSACALCCHQWLRLRALDAALQGALGDISALESKVEGGEAERAFVRRLNAEFARLEAELERRDEEAVSARFFEESERLGREREEMRESIFRELRGRR